MSFGKFISPRLFFYHDTKNRIGGKFALIWKHHFIKANFCYALTALFFRSAERQTQQEKNVSLNFLFDHLHRPVFTSVIERQTQQKKNVSFNFLFVHLHRSVFTGGIERQTRQQKNVSFNFPFGSSSPPRFYKRYRKRYHAVNC